MFVPGIAVVTPSVLAMERSAWFVTVVFFDEELFPGTRSVVVLVTFAVFVRTVPFGVFEGTLTTS